MYGLLLYNACILTVRLEQLWVKLFRVVLSQILGHAHTENKFYQVSQCFIPCPEQVYKYKLRARVCKCSAEPEP